MGGDFKSPDHVRECLTPRQIDGWWEYYKRHPFGAYRDDVRSALHAFSARQKKMRWKFFFPKYGGRDGQPASAAQLEQDMQAFKELKARKRDARKDNR